MGMTVKELIIRLLEEPKDAEVVLHTTDEEWGKKTGVTSELQFHIKDCERWNGYLLLNFDDWRKADNGNDD